jgi:hypothetical protein
VTAIVTIWHQSSKDLWFVGAYQAAQFGRDPLARRYRHLITN